MERAGAEAQSAQSRKAFDDGTTRRLRLKLLEMEAGAALGGPRPLADDGIWILPSCISELALVVWLSGVPAMLTFEKSRKNS